MKATPRAAPWRTWRMRSSYAAISANDGHAAMTRPVTVGSATATLAAKLATLPTTSHAHGRTPPRLPDRESESNVVEAATIMPSTDSGVSTATQPGWPCSATSMCIWRYETIPAMRASSPTQAVVVHLIHWPARPLIAHRRGPAQQVLGLLAVVLQVRMSRQRDMTIRHHNLLRRRGPLARPERGWSYPVR